ncbi:MAG: hypothetical protein AAFX87_08880 [Bacteroidota bacterium]
MNKYAFDILIIDENAIDNMIHKTLFRNCGHEFFVKDLPCAEYAIANIEARLSANTNLPNAVIQSIDFRNEDEYETMHRYLKCRKNLQGIKHIGMSCSLDKSLFKHIVSIDDDLQVLAKPLILDKVFELIYPAKV